MVSTFRHARHSCFILFSLIQQPWKAVISMELRRPLLILSIFETLLSILWIYSIFLAGPLRVMMIMEFPSALSALLGICFASQERQTQSYIYLFSSIILVAFDGEFIGCGLALFTTLVGNRLQQNRR